MNTMPRLRVIGSILLAGGLAPHADAAPPLQSKTIVAAGHALHYVVREGSGQTPILFIHGSPGDWQAWRWYLDTPALDDAGPRIAVDRPGFGQSEPGKIITDLRQQAQVLAALLPPQRKTLIVGHSLGAPLAVWLALTYPDRICGVISVAGSLSAQREQTRWYNKIAGWPMLKPLIPQDMLYSNQEMLTLSTQLELLEAALPQLQRPLTLVQGLDDLLVDPATIDDVAVLTPKPLLHIHRIAGQGHFVLWKKPELVVDAIKQVKCGD